MALSSRRRDYAAHFDGKRFQNAVGAEPRGLLDVVRWRSTSKADPAPDLIADVAPAQPPPRVSNDLLRVTLINHSSVLLQLGGMNILTDPIWSERASPFSWIGPRRHRAPGVRLEDLPPIDLVLLSHDHYDHLEWKTLHWLRRRDRPEFVTPIGVDRRLKMRAFHPVHALDWGDALDVCGLRVHSVPALHFSGRGLFDRNKTLWCGYMIETRIGPIYFAGDTGYGPLFEWIRERFGPPRLALLPIGAYLPRWFMAPVHMSPEEAIDAHRVLGAKSSVGIHHGTFQLADDGLDRARTELEALKEPSFLVLNNGEWKEFA